jgi:hypothetical protein
MRLNHVHARLRIAFPLLACFLIGCGGAIERPKKVDRAVVAIKASVGVGMNLDQLNSKVQELATEIELARIDGHDVAPYEEILDIYKDVGPFWDISQNKLKWMVGGTRVYCPAMGNVPIRTLTHPNMIKGYDNLEILISIAEKYNLVTYKELPDTYREERAKGAKELNIPLDGFDQLLDMADKKFSSIGKDET